jgi:hypothetical protein
MLPEETEDMFMLRYQFIDDILLTSFDDPIIIPDIEWLISYNKGLKHIYMFKFEI